MTLYDYAAMREGQGRSAPRAKPVAYPSKQTPKEREQDMVIFGSLPVGEVFDYGGNVYRKRSTRTAEIIASRSYNPDELRWAVHADYSGTWGYFNQSQSVNQERHWWSSMMHIVGKAI